MRQELTKLLQSSFVQFAQNREPFQHTASFDKDNYQQGGSSPVSSPITSPRDPSPVSSGPTSPASSIDMPRNKVMALKYPKFLKKSLGKLLQVKKFEDVYQSPEDYEKFYRFLESIGKIDFLLLYNAIVEFQGRFIFFTELG